MLRSILAVLAGWGTTGVLVVCFDLILRKVIPNDYRDGQIPPDGVSAMVLATSALFSIPAGWVTAKLARIDPSRHVVYLVLWGLLMGIISAVMAWGQIQWWYHIGLLILWIPMVLLGGRLAIKRS
ncbi:MAG TPA: hypothetical protein PLZ95_12490 [Bryobacteraceae bacterium]|nr:hypothetical protein [Bryobacteraceae bacterium]